MKLHAVDIAGILGYFLPIYLVLRNRSWVGPIIAALLVATTIIKFNWCDKLEKAPAAPQDSL